MRDLASNVSPIVAIGPATLAADSTPAALDLQGYNSATIVLAIGAGGITFDGTNKIEFVLTESSDGSTYTAVADSDLVKDSLTPATVTNGIIRALTAAHASPTVQRVGYVGSKRYLKLLADFSGTHGTGTPISATILRGHPLKRPAA